MKILRTANAGVLLTLDGVSILLDGICGDLPPYLSTPEAIRLELCRNLPNIVAFTHFHTDHFDNEFVGIYESKTGRSVLNPNSPEVKRVGSVEVIPFNTRHIGKTDEKHISFVINASKCVWFMGDASPLDIKNMAEKSKPDLLFAPFSYFSSPSALKRTKELGAEHIFVLHLPNENNDEFKICQTVFENIKNEQNIHIIELGETVEI